MMRPLEYCVGLEHHMDMNMEADVVEIIHSNIAKTTVSANLKNPPLKLTYFLKT